jgi:acylphosphatase
MAKIRAHIIISGRVQGVFFRFTMEDVAIGFNVTGWAKNRPNGKVEAILEGNKENVEKVIEWSHQGPSGAVVTNVEVNWEEYTGEFKDFSIKYF